MTCRRVAGVLGCTAPVACAAEEPHGWVGGTDTGGAGGADFNRDGLLGLFALGAELPSSLLVNDGAGVLEAPRTPNGVNASSPTPARDQGWTYAY